MEWMTFRQVWDKVLLLASGLSTLMNRSSVRVAVVVTPQRMPIVSNQNLVRCTV